MGGLGLRAACRGAVLRRRVTSSLVAQTSRKSREPERQFLDHSDATKIWEYAVLVTNTDYSFEAVGQLYRDRADGVIDRHYGATDDRRTGASLKK